MEWHLVCILHIFCNRWWIICSTW